MQGIFEEVGIVNKGKGKKKGKKYGKKKGKRKAYAYGKKKKVAAKRTYKRKATPKKTWKRRKTVAKKRKTRRRAGSVMIRVNPIGRDIVEDIKNGAIVAAGAIAAIVASTYAKERIEFVATNEYAPAGVMIATGITIPQLLKGKNRKLATLLGLGAISTAIGHIVGPMLAGKVPGFGEAEMVASGEVPTTAGYGAYVKRSSMPPVGMSGFYPESMPGPKRLGAIDPFAVQPNAYAFGATPGNGRY